MYDWEETPPPAQAETFARRRTADQASGVDEICGAVSVICPGLLGFHVTDMSGTGRRAAGKGGKLRSMTSMT